MNWDERSIKLRELADLADTIQNLEKDLEYATMQDRELKNKMAQLQSDITGKRAEFKETLKSLSE